MSVSTAKVSIYRPWKIFVTCFLALFVAVKLHFYWDVPMSPSLRNVIGTICILGCMGSFALVMRNVITDWSTNRYYYPLPARSIVPFEILMYTLAGLVALHILMTFTFEDLLGVLPVLLVAIVGILDTRRSRAYYKKPSRR